MSTTKPSGRKLTSNESGVYFMVTSLGVMRIFPIQIITEEGRVIKILLANLG